MARVSESSMLWEPSEDRKARTNIAGYMDWLARSRELRFHSYSDLWTWSVSDLDAFWFSIWDYFRVASRTPWQRVLTERRMPGARWFEGASINYAEHALRRRDGHPAVVFRSEGGSTLTLSYADVYRETCAVAGGLRRLGVGRGDRVVAFLPNSPQALFGLLATASLGAIWSSCPPEFGTRSVVERFQQIEPKVLLAADGYRYSGRPFDRMDAVGEIQRQLPSLAATITVPHLNEQPETGGLTDAVSWDDLTAEPRDLEFEPVPFDHPLWVLYSSGTTGLPKAIVQGHGGILLEHLKALSLHLDLTPEDRFFWYTTTGWMMWNFLVGGLLLGSTVIMYDGSPIYPDMWALWRVAEETGMTYFGTSAPFVQACMKAEIEPGKELDLSAIRSLGSTGSPLSPEAFRWVYDSVNPDLLLGSVSGGTDVCTAFVLSCPLLPVHEGEIQCRGLGAKVEAFDEQGRSVVEEVGELVLTEPLPSMPLFFWNDPDGQRYRESYFDVYPGVWRHGDWVRITSRGGCVIYGRSDSTLNRGGVRMGTSEFYRVVEELPEVADSLVVDTGRLGEEGTLLLFVVLVDGSELDDELEGRIIAKIRTELTPRHVPDEIHRIREVPRTLTGKKLEVPVRRVLLGEQVEKVASKDAMSNPESMAYFADLQRGSV